jgi:hypothetical protein
MKKKVIKSMTEQEMTAKVAKIETIQKGSGDELELTLTVKLSGRNAMFYQILEELIDIVGMDHVGMQQSIVEDGILEMFKKLWTAFSLSFAKPLEPPVPGPKH